MTLYDWMNLHPALAGVYALLLLVGGYHVFYGLGHLLGTWTGRRR